MMGISPTEFVEFCLNLGARPFAIGSNCGIGPAQTVAAALEMVEAFPSAFKYVAKAIVAYLYGRAQEFDIQRRPSKCISMRKSLEMLEQLSSEDVAVRRWSMYKECVLR